MDPEIVSREMRRERDSHSERLLSQSEFQTLGQVSSPFSRLAAKIRKQAVGELLDNDDLAAVTEEENSLTARESVLAALQLVHPIKCVWNGEGRFPYKAERGAASVRLH